MRVFDEFINTVCRVNDVIYFGGLANIISFFVRGEF